MASEGTEALETLLNKATSPMNQLEDVETILSFCDQINKELEGPQIAVRLLAHKIQSPQEREALYALGALETGARNCGKRFHSEIGKFRFLNEIIKVVSPKYLGSYTSEKVKKRCIEILFCWSQGLKHEPKIAEAYSMLKKQGIVKEDPVITEQDQIAAPPPPEDRKATIFEDEEKSKTLARLLRSKHPEDLQAANRLIKNMVKQDAERLEKVSKRVQQIETVGNNVKLLMEMIAHYQPGNSSESDRDIMKELYDNLEKQRPNLFRLASDTDEKDNDGITAILKCNDAVLKVMTDYKSIVEGHTAEQNGSLISMDNNTSASGDLFSLEGEDALSLPPPPPPSSLGSSSLLKHQLMELGIASPTSPAGAGAATGEDSKDDLAALGDIFASTTATAAPASNDISSLLDLGPIPTSTPVPSTAQSAPLVPNVFAQTTSMPPPMVASSPLMSAFSSASTQPSILTTPQSQPSNPPQPTSSAGLKELDALGQSLLQQSLSSDKVPQMPPSQPKVPMNQMKADVAPLSMGSTPPLLASPARKPSTEVQPLTDIFVPLQSIQPGSDTPVTPYEQNNIKVVVHFAKDRPRDDVAVMVVSIMSTNTTAVKNVSFQVAVPKAMKVKLQPPSATDLPAFNPILPPAAITQVMLVANPQKENIRAKFKLSYCLDSTQKTDVGEIDNMPVK